MDHKELCANSSVSTSASDGSAKFVQNSPTQSSRNKSHNVGSNSLGKVDAAATRPCAIIGPDRVVPPNPDDTMYMKKMPGEIWLSPENIYRRPPDYPNKSEYHPTRNISPRQTFQENMQRIMVPPTFSAMKSSDESNLKNSKLNMPEEAKYCDVPYNINSVNNDLKSVRNPDIPVSNVNPFTRNVPPSYGWPASVNVRPLRPYGAPEFYQYQEFSSCAGPRPMVRPHRGLHEENAQVFSERLYQDANIRFKPYPTGKEKLQQPRYDYISNYPSTFHPPASLPPHKYDLQKSIHGHSYPIYPQVPFKYLERRIHEPFVDGYRSHNQPPNFNAFHDQAVPPPYGPIPGNCMQNKLYSDISSKSMTVNKLQFENNNKVYLNLESRNKNYSVPENLYYNDMNNSQSMRSEILLPNHSSLNIHPMSQHPNYRKDNTPLKPYDYNPNYRIFDHSINVNRSLQRLPMQFSPNTVATMSPSDSNTSNDTAHTIGTSQEDCGYVSQSSTASIRSLESSNIPVPHDVYRRQSYSKYDMLQNTFHTNSLMQLPKNKTSTSNKKNINVRQFLQSWNEGEEEMSENNKEIATKIHANNPFPTQSEIVNNHEQLYVLGLVNVPNEELGKYDHIQKISKLPENIKGYNSIELLNQYEELLETPHVNNYNKQTVSRNYNSISKNFTGKENTLKLPRPVSPLDVEAKISQSVIHKEVGCNFEIKPCSPEMLNVEIAAPVQTILGERVIEKVVNPLMAKSSNIARIENIKSQNIVSDTVKVASCGMVNNQYSNHSINRLKSSNYSVQDLESNAGVCLASLPQLDNDIELNFPEINQQFIKANQMESNVSSALQNLSQIDMEQTHNYFASELRMNQSPQSGLSSTSDKEFSKLSKYRKSKKCELSSSHGMAKQGILKTSDSSAMLQRIDSVIIKNPDTLKLQSLDSVKIDNDNKIKPEQSHNSFKFEYNDFDSETAIDFSLNKTEDETAVSYLNTMDKSIDQQLPALEELTECNKTPSVTATNIQSAEIKFNESAIERDIIVDHPKDLQGNCFSPDLPIEKEYEENEKLQNINSENELNKYEALATIETMAVRSPKSETPTIKNQESNHSMEDIKKIDMSVSNIEKLKNSCQVVNDENSKNSKITSLAEIEVDNYEVKTKSASESKNVISLATTTKTDTDYHAPEHSQDNYKKNNFGELKEVNTNERCEKPLRLIGSNKIENKSNGSSIHKQIENEVAEKIISKDLIPLEDCQFQFKKVISHSETEKSLTLPLISEISEEHREVKKSSNVKILNVNNSKNLQVEGSPILQIGQSCSVEVSDDKLDVKNKSVNAVVPQENCKTCIEKTDFKSVSSNSVTSAINNEVHFVDEKELSKVNAVVSQESYKTCIDESDFESVSSNSVISAINEEVHLVDEKELSKVSIELGQCTQAILSSSTEELAPKDCDKKIDTCKTEYLYDKCVNNTTSANVLRNELLALKNLDSRAYPLDTVDTNNCNYKNENFTNEIYMDHSSVRFIESGQVKKPNPIENVLYKVDNTSDGVHTCLSDKSVIETFIINPDTKNDAKLECPELEMEINHNNNLINNFKMDLNIKHKLNDAAKLVHEVNTTNVKIQKLDLESLTQTELKLSEIQFKDSELTSNKNHKCFRKRFLSSWIQKLLIFTEGMCKSVKNNNVEEVCKIKEISKENENKDLNLRTNCDIESTMQQTHEIDKLLNDKDINSLNSSDSDQIDQVTNSIKIINDNKHAILTKNNDMRLFDEQNTDINHELSHANEETDMFNYSNASTEEFKNVNSDFICFATWESENDEKYICKQSDMLKEESYKKDTKISSKIFNTYSDKKPLKITKRSLSESAVEGYSDNIDVKLFQSCKRKKGNQTYVESPILSEDICNIIQTTRRNSISTFYNEDNVYIVIDNDLILSHENDESEEKICYTEITEDCSANIESANHLIDTIATDISTDGSDQYCEYSNSLQNLDLDKPVEDSWVEDVACIETVFSEDVAENIVIDTQMSPKKNCTFNLENDESSSGYYDSDHIDKIKTIYGSTICNDNTQLIETLYRTPQMNVNKTLYSIECQETENCLGFHNSDADKVNADMKNTSNANITYSNILETQPLVKEFSSYKTIDNKENLSENSTFDQFSQSMFQNFAHNNDVDLKTFSTEDKEYNFTIHPFESSKYCLTSNSQKENSTYSCSSSPEVSSTTSEEKNSSILLKITNCNGSRVSQINEISSDTRNKLSYKLTEKGEYRNYNSNFRSSRTLITKAAQKYIPPLKETLYDLKVKLPLPQHRLQTLKQLKLTKEEPKIDASTVISTKTIMQEMPRKQKPKFEDVLKSIDEINFKKNKNKVKKVKNTIPKVVIKKNENGAHYTSSKVLNRKDSYNPDLTGRKWQPWVFLEKNNFIDGMVLQNKLKAVYCRRKHSFVLADKFRKYKSVYNANFVISQPKLDTSTKGNLKYTIRLKQ